MKKIRKLAAALLCLTLLWGCGTSSIQESQPTEPEETQAETEPGNPRTEHFGLSCEMSKGFNPYRTTHLINRPIMSLLYQGLFVVNAQYQAEPVLCSTFYSSDDLLTYVFHLEAATFSDGSPLEAEDVVASLRRSMDSSVYGDRLRHVTGVSASESGEVTVTLDQPYGNLPVLLDIPIVRAEDVAEDQPMGTGPYVMEIGEESVQLTKRTDWWSDYPSSVEYSTISVSDVSTASQLRDDFEFGDTDLVCTDPGHSSYVEYRCDYELWDSPTGIFLYLGCNTGKGSAFASTSLRSGLTYGIDRSQLITIYHGFAQAACLPAAPTAAIYDDRLAESYKTNQEEFRSALSQSGAGAVRLVVNSDDPSRVLVAEEVAQQLSDSGLNVEVRPLEEEAYWNALQVGNYDFYLGEIRLSPNFDLSVFFEPDGAMNYGSMGNQELAALNALAMENSGNYPDLFQAVMEDGRLCPLLFRTYAVYATRGAISNLMPGVDNVFHNINSRQLVDAMVQAPKATTE